MYMYEFMQQQKVTKSKKGWGGGLGWLGVP